MNEKKAENTELKAIKLTFFSIMFIYAVLVVAFYYLSGDQLRYRSSRENISMPVADSGSIELSNGVVIEQVLPIKIDRLKSISVLFGTYYRTNAGKLTMELIRQSDNATVLSQEYDAAEITEGQEVCISTELPIENKDWSVFKLRITADSAPGMGVTPMVNSADSLREGWQLFYDGVPAEGALCFSATGEEYIWTGLHYWKFVLAFGVVLAIFLIAVFLRYTAGKKSYIVGAFLAINKYRFLINQLVSRDFKTRYKRSVLGMFWSILNPLLMMIVQYIVFSTIFRSDIPYFAAYLIIGLVMFNFFSEACSQTLYSIVGNAPLIKKVYMPKYIYPVTRTMMSVINLIMSFFPMLLVCLLTGIHFKKSAVLVLFFMVCLIIFSLGIGMMLATSMVFFRDTQFLWGVVSMMWMYITPTFYPETIIPENIRVLLKLNPLYHFMKNARLCLMSGISPEPKEYLRCLVLAVVTLAIGALIFRKNQNKFVLYL